MKRVKGYKPGTWPRSAVYEELGHSEALRRSQGISGLHARPIEPEVDGFRLLRPKEEPRKGS
jgi:hypothetical protein